MKSSSSEDYSIYIYAEDLRALPVHTQIRYRNVNFPLHLKTVNF